MSSFENHPWMWLPITCLAAFTLIECGARLRKRLQISFEEERQDQVSRISNDLMILLSLLLGFTLAMAVPRYDHRRELVVEEANAIGTTWLRAGTLPQPAQSRVRDLLRQYVDARLQFADAGFDSARISAAEARSKSLQNQLWSECMLAIQNDRSAVTGAFMLTLNDTIDLDAKRLEAFENRIPNTIWFLIFFISGLTSLAFGFTLRTRFWFPMLILPLMMAAVICLIADLDTSRGGTIRVSQESMRRLQADLSH